MRKVSIFSFALGGGCVLRMIVFFVLCSEVRVLRMVVVPFCG